jgi:hypothetical protein
MMYGCGTCVKVIVNLGKSLWMHCTIESFTERPIFIKVATIPWVGWMGAPTDLTYVSVWACKYITILFPIIGKADVFTGEAWPKGPLLMFPHLYSKIYTKISERGPTFVEVYFLLSKKFMQ